MDISAHVLADCFPAIREYIQKRRTGSYSCVQIYGDESQPREDVLYLAAASSSGRRGSRAVCVLEGLDEQEVTALAQDMNACIAEYSRWYEEALKMILGHASLEELLHHCAAMLDNPIAVFDNSMTLLASAGEFRGSVEGTIWELVEAGSQDLTFYSPRERAEFSASIQRAAGPYRMRPDADPSHEYVSSHIKVHGQPAGHIGLVDINAPFTRGQVELVGVVTEIVRFYLANNDLYFDAARQDDNLIVSLLAGTPASEEMVGLYLRQRGWDPADSCQLAVFMSALATDDALELLPFARRAATEISDSITVLFDGVAVTLMRLSTCRSLQRSADKLLPEEGMCCGLSCEFSDFSRLPDYYRQARIASEWAMDAGERTARFADVQPDIFAQTIVEHLGRGVACDPVVLALWDEEGDAGRELVRCLRAYLLAGGNIARAARELYVHRNTLIYRIGKLSRVLGIDVTALDGNTTMYYLCSCMLAMRG